MVLVDTSVWVDHLVKGDDQLRDLLANEDVIIHPFIVGELACGNIKNRSEILPLLNSLPCSTIADNIEVMKFIEDNALYGQGLGFIDIHLICACFLSHSVIWTRDKSLSKVARKFGINIYC